MALPPSVRNGRSLLLTCCKTSPVQYLGLEAIPPAPFLEIKMFENMRNFTAPYEYHEYPKWVTLADGSGIIVYDADEEAVALAKEEPAKRRGRPPKEQ